jgi:hypothetical protein
MGRVAFADRMALACQRLSKVSRLKRALDTVHGAPIRYLCGYPRDWTDLAA